MKKTISRIWKFITRPFITIGINKSTDRMVKFMNKHSYIFYILSFLVSAVIVFVIYFLPYI